MPEVILKLQRNAFMKLKNTIIVCLLFTFVVFALPACNNNDESKLIGRWEVIYGYRLEI